jgi:TIR domain
MIDDSETTEPTEPDRNPKRASQHRSLKERKADELDKHVFVSYAREDKKFAQELTRRLRGSKRTPWQDLRNLLGGVNWQAAIDNALRNAEALVVVVSPHSTKSQYVTYEWAFALGAGVPVIPVICKRTTLHPRLLTIQYIDFTIRRGTPWVNLRKALPTRSLPIPVTPKIRAKFNIVGGKPEMQHGYYVIRVYIHQPPGHAEQVTYEFHDETLAKRKLRTRAASTGFESAILSNGDFLVNATIRTPGEKALEIASSLYEALRRGHGRSNNRAIHGALRRIEEYGISGRRSLTHRS